MTDNLERLRARDEHLAQWAVGEIAGLREEKATLQDGLISRDMLIDSLRQRVKESEELRICADHDANELAKELAALKAGQGKPVGYVSAENIMYLSDGEGTESTIYQTPFDDNTVPLYTSAPTIPAGYVLVPLEPTDAMRIAGNVKAAMWQGKNIGTAVWFEMLAAAPKGENEADGA